MPDPSITRIEFGNDGATIVTTDPAVRHTMPIVGAPAPIVIDTTSAIAQLRADMTTLIETVAKLAKPMQLPPGATVAANDPPALNTTFSAGWMELTCTPADNLAAAVAVAAKGFKLHLATGHYKQVFHIPAGLDGWEIASASGNPDDVTLDGQGGATVADNNASRGATRLAWGKGVVHAGSPGTLTAVTVTGGGTKAVGDHDGQAGLYWDCSNGICTASRCRFTGNQNGVFGNDQNVAVQYVLDRCGFDNNGNDGGSHDTYISGDAGSSLTLNECHAEGSNAGNNIKSRIPKVTVNGGYYASKNNNRWLDCADGATCDVHGGIFVGSDTGQNVFANGDESTKLAPGNTTWDGSTIYLGNRGQNFDNAGSFTGTNLTVHATGPNSSVFNLHGGALTGLTPNSTMLAPPPAPPMPYMSH